MAQTHGVDCEAPSDSLCDTCRILNPSPGKFLSTQDASSSLPGTLASGYDPVGLESRKLGYLDEIYRRRDRCSICWLLFKATHSSDEDCGIGYDGLDKNGQRIECYVSWQLDGRLLSEDSRVTPATRRLRVFNPEELFHEAHIMLLPGDTPDGGPDPCFLGRKIPRDRVDLDTVRNWLQLCRVHHDETCEPHPTGQSHKSITSSRLRLIDLQENRLVTFEPLGDVRYATLSYVWGSPARYKILLKRHLLERYSSPGGLDPNAPEFANTVRDAMILVRSLGMRYVWVDALCIVQDDFNDRAYMVPLMDRIYGNGIVNICAAAGNDSNHGIPGSRLTRRDAVQPQVSLHGMTLLVVKTVESLIERSAWNSRAWTFQERLLSRRSLIFTEDRVFFQCRQATWSEEVESESSLRSWTLDMVRSPFKSIEKNPVRLFVEYVELYSGRHLTFGGDRLAAFEGLASVLCPPLRAYLLYGLPDSYFDFALLWDQNEDCSEDRELFRFPSWSWCICKGRVQWRMSMVSSCLLNLHEWLSHRTWVVWYTYLDPNADMVAGAVAPSDGLNMAMPELKLVWQESASSSRRPDKWHGYFSASEVPYGRSPRPGLEERPTYPTSTEFNNGWLYFWTYTAFFQLSRRSMTTPEFASKLAPGLHRLGILDNKGDWCGTIVLPASWFSRIGGIFEFAAISEARDFSLEELDTWNYYIPEDREGSEWYVYYALLIVWDDDHVVAERAGIAKIYQKAFDTGSFEPKKEWREIALA